MTFLVVPPNDTFVQQANTAFCHLLFSKMFHVDYISKFKWSCGTNPIQSPILIRVTRWNQTQLKIKLKKNSSDNDSLQLV
jgi:hypothetical protein